MSLKDIAGLCIIGVKRSRSLTAKAAWVATLAEHCVVAGILYYLFGDRGYTHGNPALQVPFKGAAVTAPQRQYNRVMSGIRQPVEWGFGKVSSLFAFVDFEKNQKLYLQPVASYWLIATMLTNCHSCFYGNNTSVYFGVPCPEVEDFLANGFV